MLEIFVYPVSAVMKLWHLMLHDLLGLEESTAWVVSLIGLVITVRALIAPFSWIMKRSSRASELMRPGLAELEERYGTSTNPEDIYALEDGKKELQEKYGYSLAAGCVPFLIQFPVLLGLYRMLLWMARPDSRADSDDPIGVLSVSDIESFQQAEIGGVPVQAYLAMSDERLLALGTTPEEMRPFVLTLLLAAVSFTTLNLILSLAWSWRTLDWSSGAARGTFKFMVGLSAAVPVLLLALGLFGPIPIALIFYWFCNNLWTLGQTIVINTMVSRRWPQQEEHRQLRAAHRAAFHAARDEARREARWLKEKRRQARRADPSEAAEINAEIGEFLERKKAAAAEKKNTRREVRRAQSQARIARRRQRNEEKKKARRREDDGGRGDDADPKDTDASGDQIE